MLRSIQAKALAKAVGLVVVSSLPLGVRVVPCGSLIWKDGVPWIVGRKALAAAAAS